jgi:uncharacterized protein YbaP (TraB family)
MAGLLRIASLRAIAFSIAAFSLTAFSANASPANPTLWTVHGPTGTAYLLSSVHVLPPNTEWRRAEIDGAIKASDTFVFEVPTGVSEVDEATQFIIDHGRLPRGTTLRSLLPPDDQKRYEEACLQAGMRPSSLDDKRPWLASVVLADKYLATKQYTSAHAPDVELLKYAQSSGHDVRYFDTTRDQLLFLAGSSDSNDVKGFSDTLATFNLEPQRAGQLIDTWRAGDPATMASLLDANFRGHEDLKARLDARNQLWAAQLGNMLSQSHTYFIAVGAAHLVGPNGLPALLRAAGYKVDGP